MTPKKTKPEPDDKESKQPGLLKLPRRSSKSFSKKAFENAFDKIVKKKRLTQSSVSKDES